MRIIHDNAIGLLIDVQEKLFPHMHQKEFLLKKMQILLQGLEILQIPLIVTQQYTKGLGNTISELATILGDYTPYEKKTFSCCDEPEILQALKQWKRHNVIIAGIETHVCILQTTIDLVDAGFKPVVVADCTSSRNEDDKKIALQRIMAEGAFLTTAESLLFELTRTSGTETFKKISSLVK